MATYIIETEDGEIDNIVEWDGVTPWEPPVPKAKVYKKGKKHDGLGPGFKKNAEGQWKAKTQVEE